MKRILTVISALVMSVALLAQDKVFTDAAAFPLYGKATQDTWQRYTRLPASFESVSREPVWFLGKNSSGLYVRFRSNSTSITVRWKSMFSSSMPHMTDTGTRGVDLYTYVDGKWRFAGAGKPDQHNAVTTSQLVGNMTSEMREFMLYLSLYDGIDSLEIGVDEGSELEQPELASPSSIGPIVMYGTSIMQGCSASRPGMAYTAIIGRDLDREVINLGFSGNGQLDYEIAELMAGVPAPSVYVMDNVPNCSVEQIRSKTAHFVQILRDSHPDVPIIFLEDPQFGHMYLDQRINEEVTKKNVAQREVYDSLVRAGLKNTRYIESISLVGDDSIPFVDGIHFTDVGMMRYSRMIEPVLRDVLGLKAEKQQAHHRKHRRH